MYAQDLSSNVLNRKYVPLDEIRAKQQLREHYAAILEGKLSYCNSDADRRQAVQYFMTHGKQTPEIRNSECA